jgi:hypothetical protein
MKNFHFEETDRVAHIENLEQAMTVKEVKRRTIFIRTDEMNAEKTEFIKKKVNRIEGIVCYWWEDKKYMEKSFHSEMLVPFEIAEKGKEEAEKWINKKKISNLK